MTEIPDPEELIDSPPTEDGAAVGGGGKHDPYAALRFRDYCFFAVGSFLAGMGSNMQSVAVGWELYERTSSAMALGWVGMVQALPIMLLALPAGQLADRWDRRRIILACQMAAVLCSVGLAVVSFLQGPVEWMYILLLLGAVGRAFLWPASQALMPSLVPKEIFSNAVTWKSTSFQIASVAGPALGGLLIAWHKTALWVYVIDAVMMLANVCFIYVIRPPKMSRQAGAATLKTLVAGFHFVWRTKLVMAAITLDLFAVLLGGAAALLPVYAKDILHVGPTGLGWLRAAPSVGALVMAIALSHMPPMRRAGRALLGAVALFGVTMVVFGFSTCFWLSLLALALSGAADNISVVVRHSLVQLRTPDEMRGRVSAVNSVFISASNELGSFESGLVAQYFGPLISVVSGGLGTIVVVALVMTIWPEIRRLGSLQDEARE
ncbi:MAG: MFS transporter [Verrucomicrobiae bacterium]|nr:MFS transporter [Verrucomicrobiae bacterium]